MCKRLMSFEESLHCPICFEVAANPVVIKICGHSFCSICVRRHFDDNVNAISHNQCPQCKAKCSAGDIVTNHQLAHAILTYKGMRNDLLNELTKRSTGHHHESSSSSSNNKGSGNKFGKQHGAKIESKLGMKSFHQKGRKYMIDTLNDICKPSKIKPKTVGDERDLARIYREIIHLHNAQIDALEPLTFDAVINEINRKEEVCHTVLFSLLPTFILSYCYIFTFTDSLTAHQSKIPTYSQLPIYTHTSTLHLIGSKKRSGKSENNDRCHCQSHEWW